MKISDLSISRKVGFLVLLTVMGWHPHAPKHVPAAGDHAAPAAEAMTEPAAH